MAKPTGAICNLDCRYCFYLGKKDLYPGDSFRMSEDLLGNYLRQVLESQSGPVVTLAWQGGEPTLAGLAFFRRAVVLAESFARRGQRIEHSFQTNGTLLSPQWAEFFAEHDFLVGVSLDGPRAQHDAYRVDKRGRPSFDRVMRGLGHLRDHRVRYNLLCTVHRANEGYPLEVYRFFRDDCGAQFIQFIPIVERCSDNGDNPQGEVTSRSVTPEGWGRFLVAVFEEWLVNDIGTVFVQTFDAALAAWLKLPATLCVFAETCGNAVALEHNGDLYSCDHFVDPQHLLGNISETHIIELMASPKQRRFGEAKRDSLPRCCLECDVRFACNGECPKNRLIAAPGGEENLNYLCAGYKIFFHHIDGSMRLMANLVRAQRPASDILSIFAKTPRNEPCPCGSGRKAKRCHGS
ncbi:MAG: anaerobic sulfatase maturase [Actinobacteria bacterium]|nr:anaerobic sulfatase maturase [Actinomycetota bacterium]